MDESDVLEKAEGISLIWGCGAVQERCPRSAPGHSFGFSLHFLPFESYGRSETLGVCEAPTSPPSSDCLQCV